MIVDQAVPSKRTGGNASFLQTLEVRYVIPGRGLLVRRYLLLPHDVLVRSCAVGRTVFLTGQAEGPRVSAQTVVTLVLFVIEGVLQLSQRAIRLRRDQRGQGVDGGGVTSCRAVQVAGREAPPRRRVAPPLFEGAAPTTRSRGTSPATSAAFLAASFMTMERPLSQIHRIGTHRSSCSGLRRSTTTAPGSTRPI